jgi:uncharacterized protein YdcH (DUF465 family)|tara:strand:+ start:1134 stop:1316 length:183 start_codon:yes stop_codon:yes gene_type:complete
MYERRIAFLEETHRVLDKQIISLEKSGDATSERITDLKKKKLTMKDELAILIHKQNNTLN